MEVFPNAEKTALLYKLNDNENTKYLCPYCEVKSLIKKIPADCEPEEVEIFVKSPKKEFIFRIPLEQLSDSKAFAQICFKNHFTFLPGNERYVHLYLTSQLGRILENSVEKYENKLIGWYKYDNKNIFLMDSNILPDNKKCTCIRDMGKWQAGSPETYEQMLQDYVFNNDRMSLAYILGFSGVLVARISHLKDLGVMLAGLSGQSTTGKTTAIKLIASIWADPDDVQGRVIMRADASNIGFNAQFAGFNGISIIFDDVDQNSSLHIGDQLNRLSRGTQRVVANMKGEPQYNRMGFGGVCIFASECPLLEKTRKESGLYPRFVDLEDISWTNDAKSAETIKAICSQNFGFKGREFAKFMEEKSEDELCAIFDDSYTFIDSRLEKRDRFTPRAIKKYAAIIATAKLLMNCFNIQFNLEEIAKLLIINENKNMEDRDKPKLAYDYIKQFFIENCNSFNVITENAQRSKNGDFFRKGYGVAALRNDILHLYISTQNTDKILNEAGFNQVSNYKKVWKEKGWTMCAEGRYNASSSNIMPSRHYHFVYRDKDKAMSSYVHLFKKDLYNYVEVNAYEKENAVVMQKLTPEIEINDDFDEEAAIDAIFSDGGLL